MNKRAYSLSPDMLHSELHVSAPWIKLNSSAQRLTQGSSPDSFPPSAHLQCEFCCCPDSVELCCTRLEMLMFMCGNFEFLQWKVCTNSTKQINEFADIGIMNFASPLDSVACLMLVAGRPISQRIFPAFSYSSARHDLKKYFA